MLLPMTVTQGEALTANEGAGWTVDDSELGARLALVRQRMRWNIKEAATECGLPAASWASWEAGASPRQLADVCDKISRRTGADYIWLIAGSARPSGRPRSTHGYPTVTDRPATQTPRQRGNRPPGHSSGTTSPGGGRTAYVDRSGRSKRDR